MDKNYDMLINNYRNKNDNSLTFLIGDKGWGKTYTINKFLKDNTNTVYIRPPFSNTYFLDTIISALMPYYNNLFENKELLNTPDMIRKKLLEICCNHELIVVFEGLVTYPSDLLNFCISFLKAVTDSFSKNKSFIIIEIDSDYSGLSDKLLKQLYAITVNTNFIKFKKKTNEELTEILFRSLNNELIISSDSMNYIINSSFGNITYLIIIINYLKQEGYLFLDNDHWICNTLPNGLLSDNILDYVLQRYDKLNDELKIVLQKSSLLGIEFNANQLGKSFNLLSVEQELSRIEKLSSLIIKDKSKENYIFENEEIHVAIKDIIPKSEKETWYHLLANYYELQYEKTSKNPIDMLHISYELAECYKNYNNIKMSIIFHLKTIRLSVELFDYQQALRMLKSIKQLFDHEQIEVWMINEVKRWEAFCNKKLGKYENSLQLYKSLIGSSFFTKYEIMEMRLAYADSLYFIGKVSDSQSILLELEAELENSPNSSLYFKVLGELSTVYGFFRDYEIASDYYRRSLNQCKDANLLNDYYIQLRKASMFWDLDITQPLMKRALEYFEEKNNLQEISRISHNIGTDLLYLGNAQEAIQRLTTASNNFIKFGSDEIHYVYNCVGVYYAVYEENFKLAINYFEKALEYQPVLFSELVLKINCASCYNVLNNTLKSMELIESGLKIQKMLGDEIPSYSLYIRKR